MNKQDTFQVSGGQRQLFLDDHGIESLDGLSRTVHQPDKKGAVIRPEAGLSGREQHSIQTHSAPIWDSERKVWQLWCSSPTTISASGYFESDDGLHWYKPVMNQVEYRGSRANHFVDYALRGHREGPATVVYDPFDPDPGRRYKSATFSSRDHDVGFAVSPDGMQWAGLDNVPAVPSQDTHSLSFDQQEQLFILKTKHAGPIFLPPDAPHIPGDEAGHNSRAASLSTSTDFANWTAPEMSFFADERDQEIGRLVIEETLADSTRRKPEFNVPETYNAQVYNLSVFRYEGRYVGLAMMFYRSARVPKEWPGFDEMDLPESILATVRRGGDWTGIWHIQMLSSRDLRSWERVGDRQPFITPSRLHSGAYDTLCIGQPAEPVPRGEELWFYYTGIRSYAIASLKYRDQGAVCLAVLRRDGFVSLDAGEEEGELVTRPFRWTGGSFHANLNAVGGDLKAQVLAADGSILATSLPVTGDQTDARVEWSQDGAALKKGLEVRLRFSLRNASFYSYWFEER
ncbi:MAG: hypothetical protein F4047_01530 [Caldilineaceae bacterium SB0670_bin_27]|uniref:Uncharacterized protein n=1 Tax=Caldilineaceae bacterium SB0664_bin_27 TaxID=2605260 RepID=A0A6B0YQ34_9CHLR|nr:hypothetical protein [Caldilineaceae bacterium SB0664_bin_27]MYJ76854.1 hypothetical protein [Caldilineaceae bacterium SB0670_bin_27]